MKLKRASVCMCVRGGGTVAEWQANREVVVVVVRWRDEGRWRLNLVCVRVCVEETPFQVTLRWERGGLGGT